MQRETLEAESDWWAWKKSTATSCSLCVYQLLISNNFYCPPFPNIIFLSFSLYGEACSRQLNVPFLDGHDIFWIYYYYFFGFICFEYFIFELVKGIYEWKYILRKFLNYPIGCGYAHTHQWYMVYIILINKFIFKIIHERMKCAPRLACS